MIIKTISSGESGENLKNIDDLDETGFISQFEKQGPGFIKDKMEFCFSFDKAGPTIKYVAICSSSTSC